jgi:dihydroorotase
MVGLETALPVYIDTLIRSSAIDWPRLVAMLTTAPATLCGLDAFGFGSLRVGGPADVTVIDPDLAWTCRAQGLVSKSKNTPFEGWNFKGRAVLTIVGGVVRAERPRTPAPARA